jgi:hypothetical protein
MDEETREILASIERERKLTEWQVEMLPVYNPKWPDTLQNKWFTIFRHIWRKVVRWPYRD